METDKFGTVFVLFLFEKACSDTGEAGLNEMRVRMRCGFE